MICSDIRIAGMLGACQGLFWNWGIGGGLDAAYAGVLGGLWLGGWRLGLRMSDEKCLRGNTRVMLAR